ncbi:hypothetical protein ACQB60_45050 [Actinomycetota bacterium Odt1-20B]
MAGINTTRPSHPGRFLPYDLALPDQVRALADRIAAEHGASRTPLSVLINNVGTMFPERHRLHGLEAAFVVNRLSPYLLTERLLV